MMKTRILFVIFAVSAGASVQAQVTANSELKQLINQSFTYFPKVKEVENTVVTAQDKVNLTGLNKMPEVTGTATYAYVKPKIVLPFPIGPGGAIENFQFAPVHNGNASVNATYTLLDFGRLKANVEKSKDELQYAQHNVAAVKNQLANQVANIYYNIIYIKEAIGIQDSVLQFLKENKAVVEAKYKNGDALKFDVVNLQANIDAEQNRKVDLENALQKQYTLLDYTTGVQKNNGNGFDFDIALADVEAALATAQATNLDFLLAKDKIKQAQSDVAIAKLGDKPIVGMLAAAGVKNGYVPDVNNFKFNYNAGIGISIPIYNAGKTKQQVKIAQNIVHQQELAEQTLTSTYRKDIEQAYTDIRSNLERIKNTEGQIEQAKYAEQLASVRFKNGVGTNIELVNASTNVQRAELTRLQYQYQLCIAKVELARLMGYQYW
ncbi:MAG: TolC family protein [Bacteroidota bacterium]|nr:TolC family protein [Bacteroidota bacterium]